MCSSDLSVLVCDNDKHGARTRAMGPGSESTLRIDEPLHLMFLVAYLITYFCCAYILVRKLLIIELLNWR